MQKSFASVLILSLCLMAGVTALNPANAKVVVEDIKYNLIPVKFHTDAGTLTSQMGDTVRIELIDDVQYQGQVLPRHLLLEGKVQKVRSSKRLGQPGYTKLLFEKAYLDGGTEAILLSPDKGREPSSQIPYQPRKKLKGMSLNHAPLIVVPELVSIPVSILHHASAWEAYLIDLASEVGTGVTHETMQRKHTGKSLPKAVAWGAFRATNIPFLYGLTKKAPDTNYKAGDMVEIQFEDKFLTNLFQEVAKAQGNEPAALVGSPSSDWQDNGQPVAMPMTENPAPKTENSATE